MYIFATFAWLSSAEVAKVAFMYKKLIHREGVNDYGKEFLPVHDGLSDLEYPAR